MKTIFDINVIGLNMCTKEALKSMTERGVDDGHVINMNRSLLITYQLFMIMVTSPRYRVVRDLLGIVRETRLHDKHI